MLEVVDTPPMDLLAANMVNLGSQRSSKMRNSELIQGQPLSRVPRKHLARLAWGMMSRVKPFWQQAFCRSGGCRTKPKQFETWKVSRKSACHCAVARQNTRIEGMRTRVFRYPRFKMKRSLSLIGKRLDFRLQCRNASTDHTSVVLDSVCERQMMPE